MDRYERLKETNQSLENFTSSCSYAILIMALSTNGQEVSVLKSDAPLSERTSYTLAPSTKAIHGDDHLNTARDVAPPLHLSTNFRYAENPEDLVTAGESEVCILCGHLSVSAFFNEAQGHSDV